ncbi:MAG: asparaginase [Methylobacter sp.]
MKNILVVFTGGTIGSVATDGTISPDSHTSFQLIQLFQQQYAAHQDIRFDTLQPLQLLSENLAPAVWPTLIAAIEAAKPEQYDGIIITHGTDTLAYTGCALSFFFHASATPLLLVSSDYPLGHPKANGVENFICAVEFIRQLNCVGVFVPYRNPQQTTQVHRATHLACSLQLSGDFFSVQGQSYLHFDNRQFSPVPPQAASKLRQSVPLKADFSARILMIKPYPGLDYSHFNLDAVDAVLHDLYHSGTACASSEWGEQHSLVEFIKRCAQHAVPVYLAPALKTADAYQSTRLLMEQGARFIWNMSIEAAYVKLLLAYGNFDDGQKIMDFMAQDIAGEHL